MHSLTTTTTRQPDRAVVVVVVTQMKGSPLLTHARSRTQTLTQTVGFQVSPVQEQSIVAHKCQVSRARRQPTNQPNRQTDRQMLSQCVEEKATEQTEGSASHRFSSYYNILCVPTHSRAKHKGDLAACGMLDAVKWRQDRHDTHARFVF